MNRAPVEVRDEAAGLSVDGITVDREAVITFPDGIPGFEHCRSFVLLSSPGLEPLRQLKSVSGPEASFVGIDPKRVQPGYRCELSDFDRERVGADDDTVLLWLVILAIDADGVMSANLRAPIVINPTTMTGYQILPHRCLYALRHVITAIE